jgi:dinuclear metal center YbgI/SA1388 family protein
VIYIKDLTRYLEQLAPLSYQESYDNAGLIVGNPQAIIEGVLVSLDCTEEVINEAIQRGCNVVVAHHPIVFKGLKKLNGKNYVERAVIKAIKHDVALYAIHTNLDNVVGGVNFRIATQLGLEKVKVLSPKTQLLMKLTTFVPLEHTQLVLDQLYGAGAGQIGEYKNCSFRTIGTGTFKPTGNAHPHIGSLNQEEEVQEHRIEVVFPAYLQYQVLDALQNAHPYEEVAYYLHTLENVNQEVGSGIIGELPNAMTAMAFLAYLKTRMNLTIIRHTHLLDKPIKKVALCGGSGGFLLGNAIRQGADAFITADYKYHEFFDADKKILLCDIGHYESEVYTKDLLCTYLSKKITNFAVLNSEVNTNPISYYV